jgi:transmembrane sensor
MTTESFIDFLSKNRFKDWVLNPQDAELSAFWDKWLIENPHEKAKIEAFKTLILKMHQPSSYLNEKTEDDLWQKIQNTISEETIEKRAILKPITHKWWAMAAALALLIAASFYFFIGTKTGVETFQTAYGETRTLNLPDGSEVVLNANSSISFNKNWKVGEDRQVTLKGEGYFIVNEQGVTTHKDRFIVHTPELDVEVLGTRFNVNTYRSQTQVVLQKGSVEIVTKTNKQEKKYSLMPEHSAVFDKQNDVVNISQVKSNVFVGWKDKRFIFDHTPLSEVAIMLENTYGLKVIINDKDLAAKQISGEIPTSERKSLLLALSTLYSLKINNESKDTLFISK